MKRLTSVFTLALLACTLTAAASHATPAAAKPAVRAATAATQATASGAAATTAAATTRTAATHAKAAATTAAAPPRELLDINTASKEQLDKLPGIGDAIAEKIVAGRPFTSKYELLQKGVVNKPTYARIKGLVIARQAGAGK